MIVGAKKPSLNELSHYGVLGMKWGHRRKATGAEIRQARRNVRKQEAGIDVQIDKVAAAKQGSAQRAREMRTLKNMNAAMLKNPDRVIAARMTRGEKIATLLVTGVGGPTGLAGLGAIAASSARSRRIEYKQETGQYDKK